MVSIIVSTNTIRSGILKVQNNANVGASACSFNQYDPFGDTESCLLKSFDCLFGSFNQYDPFGDTESGGIPQRLVQIE